MAKKIIFRADGNSQVGLGHLYRIFSLIEIAKRDYDYVLVTKEESTVAIIPNSYDVSLIPNNM